MTASAWAVLAAYAVPVAAGFGACAWSARRHRPGRRGRPLTRRERRQWRHITRALTDDEIEGVHGLRTRITGTEQDGSGDPR